MDMCFDCGKETKKLYLVDKRYRTRVCGICLSKKYQQLNKAHYQLKWDRNKAKDKAVAEAVAEAGNAVMEKGHVLALIQNLNDTYYDMSDEDLACLEIDNAKPCINVYVEPREDSDDE